jgi:hypothetical protein
MEISGKMKHYTHKWPFYLIFIVLMLCLGQWSFAQTNAGYFIDFSPLNNGFGIVSNKTAAPIVLAGNDYPGVKKIARLFQADIKSVSQIEPQLFINQIPKSKQIILIGTIGHCNLIDKLTVSGKIDVSDIKGKWETSLIQVVEQPFEGVEKALIIAGSDKRGTIYGMFDISRKIGVSPWHFWADVPAKKHDEIFVKPGRYILGEPKVKYRGIFLNDEEPALGRWAVKNYGGFTSGFYEKVFELILRLKGNFIWPAMWWASFNTNDPLNPELADEMGIVMGTSHHEPMNRAHAEWTPFRKQGEKWNFAQNPENLKKFWREGIERMGNRESIITLAMRGDGDEAMEEGTNIALLENIVKEQRKIITDVTGKKIEEVPQVWALYKEVQEYYNHGMRVPDDVTLLLCDDNWGNVRVLPNLADPPRKGGYGMYYHFDFVGGPRNYKWLNTSPLPRIWEQMNLSYRYGVDRIWVVNVGDLKPMELPISFFLDFAWNPDNISASDMDDYVLNWAIEQFGGQDAKEIAEILKRYPKYNSRRKPEMLNFDTYSLLHYHEFETVVADYNKIAELAGKIYEKTDKEKKDAFYQLVYHPALACANLNEMYYALALNYLYARQGRAATNDMADNVKAMFEKDSLISVFYHTGLSDGKWDHMMSQPRIGYTSWQQPEWNILPKTKTIDIPQKAEMGLVLEGSDEDLGSGNAVGNLPLFDSYNRQTFYAEIFNKGSQAYNYQAKSNKPWVLISESKGKIEKQKRIKITIDWDKIPDGKQQAEITIKQQRGKTIKFAVNAIKYEENHKKPVTGFIERNGFIAIDADNYCKAHDSDGFRWQVLPDHGRTGSSVMAIPVTRAVEKPGSTSPHLEYRFFLQDLPKNGKLLVNFNVSPTLNFLQKGGLKFAVSIDDQEPVIINIHQDTEVPDWKYPNWWNTAVSENSIKKTSENMIEKPGQHVLKYWLLDPGIVLQRILIDAGGLKPSYLGPPSSLKME